MKKILKIILLLLIPFIFFTGINYSFATSNLEVGGSIGDDDKNSRLTDFFSSRFIEISGGYSDQGVSEVLVQAAMDLKNIFYVIATIYFIVIVLRLLLASNTEESVTNFKKGIIWITVGIIIMQMAYAFTVILFDKSIGGDLATNLSNNLINPIIKILETLASVFFLAIAIYSFYKIVTANGNEEAIKSGKMSIVYAIIGYIVIRFARALVEGMYGGINCTSTTSSCIGASNLSQTAGIITTIINWMNSFIAIIIIIMIIYAGFNIMLSGGDEEKVKKGKNTIIYIFIGLFILSMNYIILTFLILPGNQ